MGQQRPPETLVRHIALHSDSASASSAPPDLEASWTEKLKGNERRIAEYMAGKSAPDPGGCGVGG